MQHKILQSIHGVAEISQFKFHGSCLHVDFILTRIVEMPHKMDSPVLISLPRTRTFQDTLCLPFAAEGRAGRKGTVGAHLSPTSCSIIFRAQVDGFHAHRPRTHFCLAELRVVGPLTCYAHGTSRMLPADGVAGNRAMLSSSAHTHAPVSHPTSLLNTGAKTKISTNS